MRAIPLMPDAYLHAALAAPHGDERAMLIREAWSWMHTPWMHENRVKGRGADCGNFVAGVFANAGLIEEPPLYRYPHDFYLHDDRELFRGIVAGFCEKLPSLHHSSFSHSERSPRSEESHSTAAAPITEGQNLEADERSKFSFPWSEHTRRNEILRSADSALNDGREIAAGKDMRAASPLPGDIIAVSGGKLEVTHLAIVVAWPIVIHALRHPAGCVTLDDGDRGPLAHRRSGLWRLKHWC